MSEPIPEAIPTSADPRSHRPVKKARGANTATSTQATAIEQLFLDPERPVNLPAASSATKAYLPPPPEIVANVQGSSAGAGSGEFHVYKASRRREYERLRMMDEAAKQEEDKATWDDEERKRREKDEERTRKNREKRNKKKGKKGDASNKGQTIKPTENEEAKSAATGKKPISLPRRKEDSENDVKAVVESAANETGVTIHDDD